MMEMVKQTYKYLRIAASYSKAERQFHTVLNFALALSSAANS